MNVLVSCEIDKTKRLEFFVAFEGNIWLWHNYIDEADEADTFWVSGFGGNLDDVSNTLISIGSFVVGSTIYSKMLSLNDLRTIQQNGFYWDSNNQKLYVKFYDQQPWYIQESVRAGETLQYVDRSQNSALNRPTNGYINDFHYESRVVGGTVSISRDEDDLKNNSMVFSDFSFDLINNDGALDNVREDVINLGSRVKYAKVENGETATQEDFKVVRNGFVRNVQFPSFTRTSFSCSDPRELLKVKVGTNLLNKTDYTDLADKLVDKRKPLAVGNLTNIPTVRVQDTNLEPQTPPWTTDDTIDFLVSDTSYGSMTSIDHVYITGSLYWRDATVGKWIRESYEDYELSIVTTPSTTGECSVDTSTGIITVWGYAGGDITCDCVGYQPNGTSKVTDELFFYLEEFAGLNYIESFFFISECDEVIDRASDYTGGFYTGTDGTELKQIVDEIASSVNIRLVEKEDRYTLVDEYVPDVDGETYDISLAVLRGAPVREYNEERYMSSISVGYKKDWAKREFTRKIDTSQEAEAIEANSSDVQYEFDTILDNETDASAISDERYTIEPPLELYVEFADHIDFYMYDYVIYEIKRRNGDVVQAYAQYRVIGLDIDNKTARLRYIRDVDSTAEIPGVSSTEYQQGYQYEDVLYAHRLYGSTQGAS